MCTNRKYCDKTVDAQAGSHICIRRESVCVLTHMLKQTVSVGYHKEKNTHLRILYLHQQSINHNYVSIKIPTCIQCVELCGALGFPSLLFTDLQQC